jgi:hypothetical protein
MDGYPRVGEDTARFSDYYGGVQAIVTSSGSNDSGLFESNLNDERYLPFEGSGAISRWRFELPTEVAQFDHDTISDVVLHVRYHAREGGLVLRSAATATLQERIAAATTVGSVRLISVRHEMPTEWARFAATTVDSTEPLAPLTLTLRAEHYPFWTRQMEEYVLHSVEVFASAGTGDLTIQHSEVDTLLRADPSVGGLRTGTLAGPLPAAVGMVTLYLDDTSISDLWLSLVWGAPT